MIAGSARGRRLAVPSGDDVRPTKDMVREAVFSALDARGLIVDADVLDLFAGSGAFGIEALSRGAAAATFVEQDARVADVIAGNLDLLGFVSRGHVIRADATRFLTDSGPHPRAFDLVFADPPYGVADAVVASLTETIARADVLASDALVVVERPVGAEITPPSGLRATWERTFGDTLVAFLGS